MPGFTPLQDKVLIKPDSTETTTPSGLIIKPDNAQEKATTGTVIAVGNGKVTESGKLLPMDVKAGDRVMYGKYTGTEIEIEGVKHLIMSAEDLMGRYE